MSGKVRVQITGESAEKLRKFRDKLSEITGKRFTYGDIVDLLMDYLFFDGIDKAVLMEKAELVSRNYRESPDFSAGRYYYLPKRLDKAVVESAERLGTAPLFVVPLLVERGAELVGKTYFIAEGTTHEKLRELLELLPSDEKRKEVMVRLDKIVDTTLKKAVSQLLRKYRGKR